MNLLTSEEFHKAPSANAAVRKGVPLSVKADSNGRVSICVSTATPDRMGDTVAVAGWKLANYQRNPVVLWAHDRKQLPVGRCTKLFTSEGRLMAEVEFTPKEVNPFGYAVGEMVRAGFLSASSVGFRPLKYAHNAEGGVDFQEQELLEFSIVPVPANAEALVAGKGEALASAKRLETAIADGILAGTIAAFAAEAVRANADAILAAIEGR